MAIDYSVLFLDGWLEFNARKWGLEPTRLRLSNSVSGLPKVETVIYTDRRGRIRMPKLNPYIPVIFHATATKSGFRLEKQWLSACDLMVTEFRNRGVANAVSFTPNIWDIRPWGWRGFEVYPRYTYHVELPYDFDMAEKKVRNRIRSAEKTGYTCERTTDMRAVVSCFTATAERKGFGCDLTIKDLRDAERLLGEVFRAYVCISPAGETCSARIALGAPQRTAIGLVAGTLETHLSAGCAQLLRYFTLQDLSDLGASGFDALGANLPFLASAMSPWGGQLLPCYTIRQPGPKSLARYLLSSGLFFRKRGL